MKINWGYAILIFFICYISLLIFTVMKSLTIDHSLVADDYYQHDITYQKKYDAISNRKFLKSDLDIRYNTGEKELNLDFGKEDVSVTGKVVFYRASSKRDDFGDEFRLINDRLYKLKTNQLRPGKWKVKVEWRDEEREYYKEEEIYINNA